MHTRYIYVLYSVGHPTLPPQIRYVGETRRPERRIWEHCFDPYCFTVCRAWCERMARSGVCSLRIRRVETIRSECQVEARRLSQEREKVWIQACTERGIRLLNDETWWSVLGEKHVRDGVQAVWKHLYRGTRRGDNDDFALRQLEAAHPQIALPVN